MMRFVMGKKSTKNDKSSTLGRPWALYGATFGRVGGRGGRPGKGFGKVLLELDTGIRHASGTPLCETGAADDGKCAE